MKYRYNCIGGCFIQRENSRNKKNDEVKLKIEKRRATEAREIC